MNCKNGNLDILKKLHDVCECIIALYPFSISKEKKDQVSLFLNKLARWILKGVDQVIKARLSIATNSTNLK